MINDGIYQTGHLDMKTIKLVYDKYENDTGFVYQESDTETEMDTDTKVNYQPLETIGEVKIQLDRPLTIYTWGLKSHAGKACEIRFDASLFSTKTNFPVKGLTGLHPDIQTSITRHPRFSGIMETIVSEIESSHPEKIAFVCNYGKHRSVGWAELLKKYYYPEAKITHLGLGERKN